MNKDKEGSSTRLKGLERGTLSPEKLVFPAVRLGSTLWRIQQKHIYMLIYLCTPRFVCYWYTGSLGNGCDFITGEAEESRAQLWNADII